MIRKGAMQTHVYARFSKKLKARILSPQFQGELSPSIAEEKKLRFARGNEGSMERGERVQIDFLVDPEDGIIVDAAHRTFGSPALIAAADSACELLMRKSYPAASRLSAELIDRHLRDKPKDAAFPSDVGTSLNLVLFALEQLLESLSDIPIREEAFQTPFALDSDGGQLEGFEQLSNDEKISHIDRVIKSDIIPYIELDGGGLRILSLEQSNLTIAYEGNCSSCHASTGSTLTAIEQILRAKLSEKLCVIPDKSFL